MTNNTNNSVDSLASAGGVEVVAWVAAADVRDFGKGPGESVFMFTKHGKWDVPLVLESAHLAALTKERASARESEDALFGAIQKITLIPPCTDGMGNFIVEHFDHDGRSLGIEHIDPMSVVQEMVATAQAALTAHRESRGGK